MNEFTPTVENGQERRDEMPLNPEIREVEDALLGAIEHAGVPAVVAFLKDLTETPLSDIEARMMGVDPNTLEGRNRSVALQVLHQLTEGCENGATTAQDYVWAMMRKHNYGIHDPISTLYDLEGLGLAVRKPGSSVISLSDRVYRAPGRDLTNNQ